MVKFRTILAFCVLLDVLYVSEALKINAQNAPMQAQLLIS
jgi:hypothetical protein